MALSKETLAILMTIMLRTRPRTTMNLAPTLFKLYITMHSVGNNKCLPVFSHLVHRFIFEEHEQVFGRK